MSNDTITIEYVVSGEVAYVSHDHRAIPRKGDGLFLPHQDPYFRVDIVEWYLHDPVGGTRVAVFLAEAEEGASSCPTKPSNAAALVPGDEPGDLATIRRMLLKHLGREKAGSPLTTLLLVERVLSVLDEAAAKF